jgi:hypothetical protein
MMDDGYTYTDRFISAVTADNFSLEGLTGLIKINERRGRQAQDGQFEFRVHQISNTSSLQVITPPQVPAPVRLSYPYVPKP